MVRRLVPVIGAFVVIASGVHLAGQITATPGAPPPAGQSPAPGQHPAAVPGIVLGRVIDGVTGRPIPGAMITMAPSGPFTPGAPPPQPQRVVADAQGHFVFRDLPAGRYNFGTVSPGYSSGGFGTRRAGGPAQVLELAAAERRTDAVIRLFPTAVISGTVRDETGESVAGVPVAAFRVAIVQGVRQTFQAGQTTTDDRGIYRFALLPPGDYLVAVQAWRVASSAGAAAPGARGQGPARPVVRIGGVPIEMPQPLIPPPGPDGVLRVYPTTFAPRAMSPEAAALVSVTAGEEKSADVHLALVSARRVTGRVVSTTTSVNGVTVRLMPGGSARAIDGLETSSARTLPDGSFAFVGVPSGEYTAVVRVMPTQPPGPPPNPGGPPIPPGPQPGGVVVWGSAPIAVGDADVTGVMLGLNDGRKLSGRIEFEGTRSRPAAAELERIVFALLNPASQAWIRTDANGALISDPVAPGEYVLGQGGQLPQGWTLQSAMAGGRDISDRGIDIGEGEVPDLIVTLTDTPTTLSGSVRTSAGVPDPNALVVAFPAERERWTERGARSLRTARVTASGLYTIAGLPKGSYFVAAVDDERAGRWPEADWIQTVAGFATLVPLDNRERRTVDLRTAVLP